MASKEDADLWLNDAAKREQLLRPFRDFKSFVSEYTNQNSPDYSNVRTWEIEGTKVSLLGINSAWWCRRHKFPFNLNGAVDDSKGSSVSSSVPHQIPPIPGKFTGRVEEIQILLDGFESGATITGLRGMGGVGKTALALVLAEKLKSRYSDGHIYINLQGTSTKPFSSEDAMAHIIRSFLGPAVPLPNDSNGIAGLYYSVLYGKKALILLDNAASREQVEPLIPPAGSAVLITSRNKFALPGLKEKDLDVLPLEDAKKLLLEIASRIGEDASELAKLGGCLPLALRNAAYALKEKPNLSVDNYIKRLGDARKRLELVEASFDLSYQLLTPELQKLWSLLSVFPADFDLAGAAVVWELEQFPTEDALGELVKWSLVDFLPSATGEGGRYRLHDLARDFADSRLEDAAREPAKLRHAGHYQKLLWVANELFLRGDDSLEIGLMLFDSNLMSINAGQKWASESKFKSSQIAEICSNFAWTDPILNLRLHMLTYIEWLNEALVAVRDTTKKDAEDAHLGNLGLAYFHLGDTHKAIEYYDGALKISREIGDMRGEANHLGSLGNAYFSLGDPHKVIGYYDEALKISREIGDRRGEGIHLFNISIYYRSLGQREKAIRLAKSALEIFEQIDSPQAETVRKALAEWKS